MPDQLEYIVNDAVCECDKGAKPNFFKSTYNDHVKIMGCQAATRVDKISLVNIPEFGACAVSGAPCVPAPIEWLDTYKLKIKGEQTLLFRCTLPCGVGGIVSFLTSGQIPITPEELAAMIDENSEEQPDTEETVEEQVPTEETVEEGGGGGLSWWDAAEMIPFAGGVIGMVRSGVDGDWLGFGLSAGSLVLDVAGLVSFGGGNAASAAVKGGKLARVGYKAAKAYNKTRKVIKGLKTVTKTVAKAAPKLLTKAGAKVVAKALANKIHDIALKTGKICVFACFPAGTLVNAERGQIPIEQIKTGDKVWAFDESTGVIEYQWLIKESKLETACFFDRKIIAEKNFCRFTQQLKNWLSLLFYLFQAKTRS